MELKRTNDYLDNVMANKIPPKKEDNLAEKDTDPGAHTEQAADKNNSALLINGHGSFDHPDTSNGYEMEPTVDLKEATANGALRKDAALPSPKDAQPQQIQNLVAALVSVKKDLDMKTQQVMVLEESLLRERMARESAEERAERLEQSSLVSGNATISPATAKIAEKEADKSLPSSGPSLEEMQKLVIESNERAAAAAAKAAESAAEGLRSQLQEMVSELQNAKADLEAYKQRVHDAEKEGNEAKTSLRELIEKVKRDDEERAQRAQLSIGRNQNGSSIKNLANGSDSLLATKGLANGVGIANGRGRTEGGVMGHVIGMTSEKFAGKEGNKVSDFAKQGGPYMSMLGVVIFGVGLMVVINSWQKGER